MTKSIVGDIWVYSNVKPEYYLVLDERYDWKDKQYIYSFLFLGDGTLCSDVVYSSPLQYCDEWRPVA